VENLESGIWNLESGDGNGNETGNLAGTGTRQIRIGDVFFVSRFLIPCFPFAPNNWIYLDSTGNLMITAGRRVTLPLSAQVFISI